MFKSAVIQEVHPATAAPYYINNLYYTGLTIQIAGISG